MKPYSRLMQEQVDQQQMFFAKDYLNITEPSLLLGRMSDSLIQTIDEVKQKHRTSLTLEGWFKDGYFLK